MSFFQNRQSKVARLQILTTQTIGASLRRDIETLQDISDQVTILVEAFTDLDERVYYQQAVFLENMIDETIESLATIELQQLEIEEIKKSACTHIENLK